MNTLFDGLSEKIYETFFKEKITQKNWKTGYMTREMDGIKQETLFIGTQFEDLFWQKKEKLRNNHACIRITQKEPGEYEVLIMQKNMYIFKNGIRKLIKEFIEEKETFEAILTFYEGVHIVETVALGEKAKKILGIRKEIKKAKCVQTYDQKSNSFSMPKTVGTFSLSFDVEKGMASLQIYGKEIARFSEMEDVEKWIIQQQKELVLMSEIEKEFVEVVKERMKTTNVQLIHSRILEINEKRYEVAVIRKFLTGKVKIHMLLDKQKANAFIEDAMKRATELAIKFSNTHRLKQVTGKI